MGHPDLSAVARGTPSPHTCRTTCTQKGVRLDSCQRKSFSSWDVFVHCLVFCVDRRVQGFWNWSLHFVMSWRPWGGKTRVWGKSCSKEAQISGTGGQGRGQIQSNKFVFFGFHLWKEICGVPSIPVGKASLRVQQRAVSRTVVPPW